jgi:hypothetical protein
MNPDHPSALTDPPIACSLSAGELAERTRQTEQLARRALRSREPLEHGALLTFDADDGIEAELREFVAAEARCCRFLRMDLRRSGDVLELEVTAPDDARPIIDALFA